MQLVIVESPAKAKTIEKYLGRDYRTGSTTITRGGIEPPPSVRDAPPKVRTRTAVVSRGGFGGERLVLAELFDEPGDGSREGGLLERRPAPRTDQRRDFDDEIVREVGECAAVGDVHGPDLAAVVEHGVHHVEGEF